MSRHNLSSSKADQMCQHQDGTDTRLLLEQQVQHTSQQQDITSLDAHKKTLLLRSQRAVRPNL